MASSVSLNIDYSLNPMRESSENLSSGGITAIKVMRIASYSFTLISSIGTALTLFSRSSLAPWFALASGVFFGASYKAYHAKDYNNPREVLKMRQDAFFQNFTAVVRDHGLKNILKHNILDKNVLENKFAIECSNSSMYQVLRDCPLPTIFETQVFSKEFLLDVFISGLTSCKLQNFGLDQLYKTMNNNKVLGAELFNVHVVDFKNYSLISEYCAMLSSYKNQKDFDLQCLDSKYSGRTERLLSALNDEKNKAFHDAEQLRRKIIEDGQKNVVSTADLHTTIDALFTDKKVGTLFFDNLEKRSIGYSNINDTAKSVSQSFYEQKLVEIEAKRKFILSNNLGSDSQSLYDAEFATVVANYDYMSFDSHQTFLTKLSK